MIVIRPRRTVERKGANMSNKSLRMSNFLVRISIVLLFFLLVYLAFLLIGIDLHPLFIKVKSMLLAKGIHFLLSRLGSFGLLLAGLLLLEDSGFSCNMMALSGAGGASSSSGRPPLDLNLPPALLDLNLPPADEPEPASTSDLPQQEVERHRQIEEHIRTRLIANSPPGTNPDQLFNQARETAQLKRQIVDRMSELDPDHSDFWVQHRDAIISDSILTNRKTDYSPHKLSKMVEELTQGEAHASHTYKKMCSIKKKFFRLGTFKY